VEGEFSEVRPARRVATNTRPISTIGRWVDTQRTYNA
jgi:hypothetical protein